MARLPRYVIPGQPQHIIQRGNNRQPIFAAETDYPFFRDALVEAAAKYGLAIHAYVWMTNHVHLLATPGFDDSISKTFQSVGRRYVQYFNQDKWGQTRYSHYPSPSCKGWALHPIAQPIPSHHTTCAHHLTNKCDGTYDVIHDFSCDRHQCLCCRSALGWRCFAGGFARRVAGQDRAIVRQRLVA